jgi:hypothetical protein
MSVPKKILYKKNSQFYRLVGLKDNSVSPAAYLNSATCTATLKDSTGAPVPGFDSVAGSFVAASNGTYDFPVDASQFDPPAGSGYVLCVSASQNGKQWYIEYPIKVAVRQLGTETTG